MKLPGNMTSDGCDDGDNDDDDDGSFRQAAEAFVQESEVLTGLMDSALKGAEKLDVAEIVRLYYQVISTSSIIRVLRTRADVHEDGGLSDKIRDVEAAIEDRFNSNIHRTVMAALSERIRDMTDRLRKAGKNGGEKTAEDVKNEAGMFEKLREIMSTREFVGQYDRQIGHDD